MKFKIQSVVETVVYVNDLDASEDFYGRILGLQLIQKEVGRHLFYEVGNSNVLLLFLPDVTLTCEMFPTHGAHGPGHFALGIKRQDLDLWREHLNSQGIAIEQEADWPRGGKSIYFRDPAGNLAELVTPGLWGLPSGW